ncbi:hypothetical protein DLAC_11453 [Tieghemostelium lacteum]|uniref:Uncharacterized protein n=1 Tax=Tieghemostelium lacteum TaxID=361077 RepID=A0A152A7A6_TIELA|nr:hypothetical protein DLAC_11453 [Tieghemostelium lacteum]|eukprot:KYR02086.1 hypothetical protein DLAC_11453 [Tieghemostelium lacteum]
MSNNRTIKISGKKKGDANNKSRPIRQIHINSNNNNRSITRNRGSRAEYQRLIISPVPSSVDRNDLLNYIKQKAYRPNANFVKTVYRDQQLTILVERADANAIVNLNNTRYRELQLSIIRDMRPFPPQIIIIQPISKVFEDHLKASYHNNPMKDAVDFSFINGSNPIVDFNSDKTVKVLFQIISKQCPKVLSIQYHLHHNLK